MNDPAYKEITECTEYGCVKRTVSAQELADIKNANKGPNEPTHSTDDFAVAEPKNWNGRDVKPGDKWTEKWTEDFENGEASEETVEFMIKSDGLDMDDIKERKEENERIALETENEDLQCKGTCADEASAKWRERRSFLMSHRRPPLLEGDKIPAWVGPDHPQRKGRDCDMVCCAKKTSGSYTLSPPLVVDEQTGKLVQTKTYTSGVPNFYGPVCSGVKPTTVPAAKVEDENGGGSGGGGSAGGALGVDDPAGPATATFVPNQANEQNSMTLNDMHPDWKGHPDLAGASSWADEPLFVTPEQKAKFSEPPDPDDLAKPLCLEQGGWPAASGENTNTCNGNFTVDTRKGNCAVYLDGSRKKLGGEKDGNSNTTNSNTEWPADSTTGPGGTRRNHKPYEESNWPE